jgi:hypothetical protein
MHVLEKTAPESGCVPKDHRSALIGTGNSARFLAFTSCWIRKDRTMPWTDNDADKHTHKATTPALKELWAKVANESLGRTGDEGRAIREANAVIARQADAR